MLIVVCILRHTPCIYLGYTVLSTYICGTHWFLYITDIACIILFSLQLYKQYIYILYIFPYRYGGLDDDQLASLAPLCSGHDLPARVLTVKKKGDNKVCVRGYICICISGIDTYTYVYCIL